MSERATGVGGWFSRPYLLFFFLFFFFFIYFGWRTRSGWRRGSSNGWARTGLPNGRGMESGGRCIVLDVPHQKSTKSYSRKVFSFEIFIAVLKILRNYAEKLKASSGGNASVRGARVQYDATR